MAGSGSTPGRGFTSRMCGTPRASQRTSMRAQSRQRRTRYAASTVCSICRASPRRERGGALEDGERPLRSVPHPLRLVRVEARRPARQRIEVDLDRRQDAGARAVPEDRARELAAGQPPLDERRLPVPPPHQSDGAAHLGAGPAERCLGDPLAGALVDRLHDDGQPGDPVERLASGRDGELRGRDAVVGEDLLGAALVQTDRQGQGIASRVGHAPELAEGRHVGLAVRAPEPFGHVEDDVGLRLPKPEREVLRRLEPRDLAGLRQRRLDRRDRDLVVPLGVEIRRVPGAPVPGGAGAGGSPVVGLPVEGEADAGRRPGPAVSSWRSRHGRPAGRAGRAAGGADRRGRRGARMAATPRLPARSSSSPSFPSTWRSSTSQTSRTLQRPSGGRPAATAGRVEAHLVDPQGAGGDRDREGGAEERLEVEARPGGGDRHRLEDAPRAPSRERRTRSRAPACRRTGRTGSRGPRTSVSSNQPPTSWS